MYLHFLQLWKLDFYSCGKLLKSEVDAQAHAARTKHTNFSESTDEIKPLTAEEKQEQLNKYVLNMTYFKLNIGFLFSSCIICFIC